MPNEQLIASIKQHLAQGDDKEMIKQYVMQLGNTAEEFETAFNAAAREGAESATSPQVTAQMTAGEGGGATEASVTQPQPNVQDQGAVPPTGGGLPPIGSFLSDAFSFGWRRYDLVLWGLLFQVVIVVVMGVAFGVGFVAGLNPVVIGVVSIVGVVAMMVLGTLNIGALLYATASQAVVTYMDGFMWTWSKIVPFILLYLGFTFTIMGGLLLLIVPGLVVLTATCLTLTVFVKEDLRGIKALDRSRQLVRGHGWAVFGRLILLWLVMFAMSLVGTIASAVIPIIGMVLQPVIGLFAAVIGLRALASLYFALAAQNPVYVPSSTSSYRILFWIGLVIFPIAIISAVTLGSLSGARETGQDLADMQQLMNMRFTAELHAYHEDGTTDYSGVCTELETLASNMTGFMCNDSMEAYAAEIELRDGYYCVDSAGYSEQSELSVINGTSCGS